MTEIVTEEPQTLDPRRTRSVVKIAPLVQKEFLDEVRAACFKAQFTMAQTGDVTLIVTNYAAAGFSEPEIRRHVDNIVTAFRVRA